MSRLNPKIITRGLILFLVFGGLGLGIYLFNQTRPAIKITKEDIQIDSKAAMKLNVLEQVSQKDGVTEWELKAASATLINAEDKAVLEQVNVVFYTKDQKKVFLTADEGELNTRTQDMVFSKNVVVKYETYTLKTDKLHYKKKPHIIQSDAPIRLENKDSEVEADEMIMDLRANRIVLNRNVKGIFSENFKLP